MKSYNQNQWSVIHNLLSVLPAISMLKQGMRGQEGGKNYVKSGSLISSCSGLFKFEMIITLCHKTINCH